MAKIVTISYDPDLEDPSGFDGQWKLYSFGRKHRSYTDPDTFFPDGKPTLAIRRKLEVGTAFVLSYHEHGSCVWSRAGGRSADPFDTVDFAGLLVWEHDPSEMGAKSRDDRAKDADCFLRVYTDWCNGHGYYYSVEERKVLPCGHTETEIVDSCGGFFGTDVKCMIEQIREAVAGDVADIEIKGEARDLVDASDLAPVPQISAET